MKKRNNHIEIHKHLIQEELLDYNNGVLGNDEMYRLELHLNECELCSDALEGISFINDPEKSLNIIQGDISPYLSKKSNFNYLAVAASITLVALTGVSYWLLSNNSKDRNLALNEVIETKEIPKKEKVLEEETDLLDIDATTEENVEDLVIEDNETPEPSVPVEKMEDQEPKPLAADRVEQNKDVEPENKLAAVAIIDSSDELEVMDIDTELMETSAELQTSQQGMELQSAPSTQRTAKKTSSSMTVELEDQKEPSPAGGMNALKSFISANLKYPQEAIYNKIKGTVVLEITISKDGTVKNMETVKSIGYGCDAEAKRLITTGPNWTPAVVNGEAIESKRQVKIKFKY